MCEGGWAPMVGEEGLGLVLLLVFIVHDISSFLLKVYGCINKIGTAITN